jgi:hypothetical protein
MLLTLLIRFVLQYSIVRHARTIETRDNVHSKDTGLMEIDGFLDKDKHLNCMWLKRLITNGGTCEVKH